MDKYKGGTYHKFYFRGGSNNDLSLLTCEDKIFIPSKLQSYVLHWANTYIFHPGMDITELIIHQHLYWTGIKNSTWKDVTNCDTYKNIK